MFLLDNLYFVTGLRKSFQGTVSLESTLKKTQSRIKWGNMKDAQEFRHIALFEAKIIQSIPTFTVLFIFT